MNQDKSDYISPTNASKAYIKTIKDQIIDKQACTLFEDLKWIHLEGVTQNKSELFPIVLTGIKSVVTNFIVSAADTVYMYFQRYPRPVPAPVSEVDTKSVALVPVGFTVVLSFISCLV